MRTQSNPSAELHRWSSSWWAQSLQLSSCLWILLTGAEQEPVLPEAAACQMILAAKPPQPVQEGSRVWPAFSQLISLLRGALFLSGWHTDVQELSTPCEDVTFWQQPVITECHAGLVIDTAALESRGCWIHEPFEGISAVKSYSVWLKPANTHNRLNINPASCPAETKGSIGVLTQKYLYSWRHKYQSSVRINSYSHCDVLVYVIIHAQGVFTHLSQCAFWCQCSRCSFLNHQSPFSSVCVREALRQTLGVVLTWSSVYIFIYLFCWNTCHICVISKLIQV